MTATDWDDFLAAMPWLVPTDAHLEIGAPTAGARSVDADVFPTLAGLLNRSTATTPVVLDGRELELVSWRTAEGSLLRWLCAQPSPSPPVGIHVHHGRLLADFGGIVERGSPEPSSWLLNCNEALTEQESRQQASTLLDPYTWLMEDHGGAWPIDPTEYYSIAAEANGNTTLCSRQSGAVLLFAPDHAFDHIEQLDGCPPYSLYTIRGAPDFRSWVEAIARQWLAALEGGG